MKKIIVSALAGSMMIGCNLTPNERKVGVDAGQAERINPMDNSQASTVPYVSPNVAEKTTHSDEECEPCLKENCMDEAISCAKTPTCSESVHCLFNCRKPNLNACAAECAAKATDKAKLATRAVVMCRVAACGKQCFAN